MLDLINERQREINREFTPNVCNAMLVVYNICSNEAGPGQFNRMKVHMTNHVDAQKDTMFQRATQVVRNMMMDLTNALEKAFGSLPKTLFFEYQSLAELARYFIKAHPDRLAEPVRQAPPARPRRCAHGCVD